MRSVRGIVAFVCLGLLVGGCKTVEGGPDRLYSVEEEKQDARDDVLPRALAGYNAARSEAERIFFRNEYIARRMYVIDVEYTQYETALTRERQEYGFISSVAAQGLGTAGAVFTPVNTVRTLSALSSGVSASKGFYDSDLLLTKTVQIAQGHMRAQRDRVARTILIQKAKSSIEYPLSAALHDLEDYYRAGTVTAGLIEAVGVAGEDAQLAAADKARAQGIPDPSTPIPAPPPKIPPFSDSPPSRDVQAFQAALCISKDGKVGPELLKAAANFIAGRDGGKVPTFTTINKRTEGALRDAAEAVPDCKAAGFRNAYEVGAFGVLSGNKSASDRIKELQTQLGVAVANGKLDPPTRAAVAKFRADKKISGVGDEINRDFMKQIFN